jgi:DNA-binding response OmpR family regulator
VKRILIVDDDAALVRGLERGMRNAGFDTKSAGTVAEAVSFCSQELFDLCIVDFDLPDGNGIDVMKAIRKSNSSIPIVLYTGTPPRSIGDLSAFSPVRVFQKPTALADLVAAVRKELGIN